MRHYRERLAVPAAWWALAVPVVALLGAYAVYANLDGTVVAVSYGVLAAGYAAALAAWGSSRIEVSDGRLAAGRSVLPLACVTEVVPLDEEQSSALRGPRADPAAHMVLRPFLKRAVYIGVRDPAGQVPYWLVGTRRPGELAAAIKRCCPGDVPAGTADRAGAAG